MWALLLPLQLWHDSRILPLCDVDSIYEGIVGSGYRGRQSRKSWLVEIRIPFRWASWSILVRGYCFWLLHCTQILLFIYLRSTDPQNGVTHCSMPRPYWVSPYHPWSSARYHITKLVPGFIKSCKPLCRPTWRLKIHWIVSVPKITNVVPDLCRSYIFNRIMLAER